MTIEDAILADYKRQIKTNEPDVDLLFDIISKFIKENDWIYEGNGGQKEIYKLPENEQIKVNCFTLSDLFIYMSKKIGISPDKCSRMEIPNFCNTINNPVIQGEAFSPTCPTNTDGLYEFDVHCIARINDSYFDLLLQVKYPLINDGADVYYSLFTAMSENNISDFKYMLPYLLNKNEQTPETGWTLLHQALWDDKFDFAMLLLKYGAQDDVPDNGKGAPITPMDILNNKLYAASVSLETLDNAKKYLELKMELIIEKRKKQLDTESKTSNTLRSFWRKKQNTPALSEVNDNEQEINTSSCKIKS